MGSESPDAEDAAVDEGSGPMSTESLAEELGTESVTYVDALNEEVGRIVEGADGLDYDYVVGDVSDWGVSASGHGHFDLVHDGSTVHCVVFGFRLDGLAVDPEDGTQVAVKGELSYYAQEGSVSVIVEDLVALGEGTYSRVYEENRRRLAEDGCLDEDAKVPLPELPRRIGLVTSADSDAREDAVTSIHDRHPGVDVAVRDVTVQGDDAMAEMMAAISDLDDDARIDVVVLTRGGGADKHLRVFDETPLCRVIHRTDTPVVVGVGHERDRTLADDVADERVMTPTEVGRIVPDRDALVDEAAALGERLRTGARRATRERLAELAGDLDGAYRDHAASALERRTTDLEHAHDALARERLTALARRLDHAHERLEQRKDHERERAATVEAHERTRRRLLIAVAVLLVLVLGLLAYVLLAP